MNKSTGISVFACLLGVSSHQQVLATQPEDTSTRPNLAATTETNTTKQCQPRENEQQQKVGDSDIVITAANTKIVENNQAEFTGGVTLCYGDTNLNADAAYLSKNEQTIKATGNITYNNDALNVDSQGFKANFEDSSVHLDDAQYTLADDKGRGEASNLSIEPDNAIILTEATFSTCPIGDDSWLLAAEEIYLDAGGWGEAWNAVIKVKDTPILYLPYLSFPIESSRKSGFLYPRFSSSGKFGLDISLPYYWNIAENYDATITPRYMSNRGMQFQGEFRYLTEQHNGTVNVEWLGSDDEAPQLGSRHLIQLKNKSQISDEWRAFIDFADVSDDGYLADLRPIHYSPSDTQLYKQLEVGYFGDSLQANIRLQDFEILGDHTKAYQALPQIELSNAKPIEFGPFLFNVSGEFSHFRNSEAKIVDADRLHFQPSITLPYETPAITARAEVSLLSTVYRQTLRDDLVAAGSTEYDKNVTRNIPQVRLYGKVNFQRDMKWGDKTFLNTFEPQVQYLYSPFKDQSRIGNFDSTRLQDDYYGLFRNNRFSGLDRIAEANQIAIGATTRVYDKSNQEIFHASFGQIFYISRKNNEIVTTPDEQNPRSQEEVSASRSALAGDIMLRWSKRWSFYGEIQYDSVASELSQTNLSLDYRTEENINARLNHRYSRNVSGYDIEQVGLTTSFPINKQWHFIGGYSLDLDNKRSIESFAGLQYESCCWAVRAVWRRNIDTNLEQFSQLTNPNVPFDSSFSIQFTIKGASGNRLFNIKDITRRSVFGYRRPYFINN